MKPFHLIVLSLGILLTLGGLALSLASAPKYGVLMTMAIACDVIAAGCFVYVFPLGQAWKFAAIVAGMVIFYTVSDITLRLSSGVRVLDIFR
ncbi:MAG: hypothetical protein ACJ8R9_25840 [Steroidobacteraceae bacterium]